MKKFCTIFFITLFLVFLCIVAEASSIQDPALWPAISDINLSEDGSGYIFDINVMVYCPDGIEGDLLVAAYNENDRLLNISYCGKIKVSPYTVPGNCSEKDKLASTFSAKLNIAEKDKVIIKAFVMNFDTLTPKITSGKITFEYNGANSCVTVNDYTLESNHYNHTSGDYYYYYYYDGNCESVAFSLDGYFDVGTFNSFYFCYYPTFDISSKEYEKTSLRNTELKYDGFSGVKIRIWIASAAGKSNLERYGFKAENIKIYCNFGDLG